MGTDSLIVQLGKSFWLHFYSEEGAARRYIRFQNVKTYEEVLEWVQTH